MDDEEDQRAPEGPPLPTHCDVPLKFQKQRAALLKPAPGQRVTRNNKCRKEFLMLQQKLGDIKPLRLELSHIQPKILTDLSIPTTPLVRKEYMQQENVATKIWSLQSRALSDFNTADWRPHTPTVTQEYYEYLYNQYKTRVWLEEGVLSSGSKHYRPQNWWNKDVDEEISSYTQGNWGFYITENLFLVRYVNDYYLASRDHLLILSDLASQRYISYETAVYGAGDPSSTFLPFSVLSELYNCQDEMLERSGNEAYKLIYTLEAECISRMVGDIPVGNITGRTFRETVEADSDLIAQQLDLEANLLRRRAVLTYVHEQHHTKFIQLFGLYRMWGHPTVEPLDGAIAMKKISTHVRLTNPYRANELDCKFKEEFIIRWVRHHSSWPPLDVSDLGPFNILRQSYENNAEYPKHHRDYDREDLTLVKLEKVYPVDPKFDLIELLADKSMSLAYPELYARVTRSGHPGDSVERSVIINWIKSDLHDPVEFLMKLDREGFPLGEFSVGLREKEREGKLDPRMFGLLTLVKRMYVVLTEALLSEHLFKLFPEITMTDDEISLDKKRMAFNATLKDQITFNTSMDFKKWNTYMRRGETDPMFHSLDCLYGFNNVYTRTHDMFESSFMYLLNGSYLPTFVDDRMQTDMGCWTNHLGGIDGLRQKGWTLWTVILILQASETIPCSISLMGQGDNHMLREIYPKDTSRDQALIHHFQLIKNLNDLLKEIGPPLKVEETWTSEDLFVYGKYVIYKGAPQTISLKKLVRLMRLSNEDYPTIESAISSASANLTAALGSDTNPNLLFYIYLKEVIGILQSGFRSDYLQQEPLHEQLSESGNLLLPGSDRMQSLYCGPGLSNTSWQPDRIYEKILLCPKALGGYPILNLFNCFLRGFPDEVSFALASNRKFIDHATPQLRNHLILISNPPLNPHISYELLLEHPTALNIQMPTSPNDSRRMMVQDFITHNLDIRNPYLREFIEISRLDEDDKLVDYLMTAQPCNPRLLGMFRKSTTEARLRQVLGKMVKTSTLSNLARVVGKKNLHRKIRTAEMNHLRGILRLFSTKITRQTRWMLDTCSLDHAQHLRQLGWNKEIVGVSCAPPMEFLNLEVVNPDVPCGEEIPCEEDKGYILVRFDNHLPDEQFRNPNRRGQFNPYRGSVTIQKVSGYGDKMASQAEPVLQKVLKLFALVGWGIPAEGNMHELAKKLLDARTDMDPNILLPDMDNMVGSIHHRLQDERTGHGGAVPILPNFGSKFGFNTFPLVAYSKGTRNVTLMFQSIMSFTTTYLSWMLSSGWVPSDRLVHIHVANSCCVQEVSEDLVEAPHPSPDHVTYKNVDSPYLYTKAEQLNDLLERKILFRAFRLEGLTLEETTILHASLVSEEAYHLISPSSWHQKSQDYFRGHLTINWVLKLQMEPFLMFLATRLMAYFSSAGGGLSIQQFIVRVVECIKRSPLSYWICLANLIHVQDLHHQMSSGIINTIAPGVSTYTNTIMGNWIKKAIINVLLSIPESLLLRSRYHSLNFFSRPVCGVIQHPSMLYLCRDWVTGHLKGDLDQLRRSLTLLLSTRPYSFELRHLHETSKQYLEIGQYHVVVNDTEAVSKTIKQNIAFPMKKLEDGVLARLPRAAICFLSLTLDHFRIGSEFVIPEEYTSSTDYLQNLLKGTSLPSAGSLKLFSIYRLLQLKNHNIIACLADGCGGFTYATLTSFPDSHVFFNTLIDADDLIQQASPLPFIPALAGQPQKESRIIGFHVTTDFCSDITHPKYAQMIQSKVMTSFDGITCDAENSNYYTPEAAFSITHSVLRCAQKWSVNWIILKSYCIDCSLLSIILGVCASVFRHIKVFRSAFSARGNTEVYIFCSDMYNAKVSPPVMTGNKWKGLIPTLDILKEICSMRECLTGGETWLTPQIASTYLDITEPSDRCVKTRLQLLHYLPFLIYKQDLTFPHSVLNWITSTSIKIAGDPSAKKKKLESRTLDRKYLKSWAFAWIFMWVWSNLDIPETKITSAFSSSYFYWYRLVNDKWEISLGWECPPLHEQGKNLLVIETSKLLATSDLKLMYKLIGVARSLFVPPLIRTNHKGQLSRGSLNDRGEEISEFYKAVSKWVKSHVQTSQAGTHPITFSFFKPTVLEMWKQRSLHLKGQKSFKTLRYTRSTYLILKRSNKIVTSRETPLPDPHSSEDEDDVS